MNNDMRLSIIIPVYNEEKYLERCLSSLGELPEGVEILIFDDGSIDKSWEIACKYIGIEHISGSRWSINKGVSVARNKGINAASGEYITFLDADDALAPGGIGNILKALDAHPGADIIQLNHQRCHDNKCKLELAYTARAGFYNLEKLPPKWAPVWNKIYRKALLDEHGIRFPKGQQFDEDRRFNIECLKHTGGIVCDERVALCKYFDNEASLCHTINRGKMLGAVRGLADMLETEENPRIIELIRSSIIMHLNSKKFKEAFGGGKP